MSPRRSALAVVLAAAALAAAGCGTLPRTSPTQPPPAASPGG